MNTLRLHKYLPRPGSLRFSVLGLVLLPLIITSALGVSYFVSFSNEIQEDRLKEDLGLLARAIRLPISQSLERGEIDHVSYALQSVFEIGRVYGASIYNVNGDRIAAAGITERNLNDSRVAATTVATGQMQEGFREVEGQDLFSQFLPLVDAGGRINGLVQVSRRSSDFDNALKQLRFTAWTTWGVLAIMMTVIVILGHYGSVGRYVRNLLNNMARVEQGDRSVRVDPAGPRELIKIGSGLNRMLDGIEQAEARVVAHQKKEQELNERLRNQEKMAAIGRVAGGVAHELGAPLSVIGGRTRRLMDTANLGGEEHRQLRAIREQVRRLEQVVRQLLDYCRPDSAEFNSVSVDQVTRDALAAVTMEQGEAAPRLPVFDIEAKNAPLPHFRGNALRLELALVNLVRNAVQAGANRIHIVLFATSDSLNIQIRDDGSGLQEDSQKIQEPFFTTKLPGKGTGLGLAIVNNVLTEHNATMSISDTGHGCCVEIRLPLENPNNPTTANQAIHR